MFDEAKDGGNSSLRRVDGNERQSRKRRRKLGIRIKRIGKGKFGRKIQAYNTKELNSFYTKEIRNWQRGIGLVEIKRRKKESTRLRAAVAEHHFNTK